MYLLLPGIAAAYLLTFARVGTLIMLMPGIGETVVSPRLRLAFALLVALVLFPMVRPLLPPMQGAGAGPALIGLLIGEIAVGLVLGLSVRAVLAALQTTGTIVAQQLGLSYAMTVDPTTAGQQATLGTFLTLLGITLVLAADLHHLALAGIRDSYAMMPPAGVPATGDAASVAIRAVARGFALAVQIAAPFIAFGILFNLGLGVLSRLMPQMQVFFVATPASILIGMLVLLATLGVMMAVFVDDLGRWLAQIGRA
ncbi:MAG: flagellar type III secretion system protein FliR [Methylobacterium sp.]|uniref:flagellar biosynthetic protein FliR n=1 Tax=Methylobacterium sp. TaxID=409 RepID=UPI00259056C4|nr:flagellar biosynthetic protein FliR [Methylobacterium sp.]MBY0299079.1 flagellar type III secretion system protein FliR [Methylobacterium sp.]